MKRNPPQGTAPAKRPRRDSDDDDLPTAGYTNVNEANDPFRPTLQRKVVDICEHGLDEDGFIQMRVFMKWPKNPRVQASAVENGQTVKFEVAFLGRCPDFFKSIGLEWDFRDECYLSLKGARLERKVTVPTGHLPIALNYTDGVRLKFISRKTTASLPSGSVVDYWAPLEKSDAEQARKKPKLGPSTGDASFGDDWFITPAMPTPQDTFGGEQSVSAASQATKVPEVIIPTGETTAPEKPVMNRPNSPAPSKSITPPPQPAPKKLYRDIPGRPRKGDTNGHRKQFTPPTTSHKDLSKPEDLKGAAQTVGSEGPKESGKHASKKASKKAAREAKKALRQAQTAETFVGPPPEQPRTEEPSSRPSVEQVTAPPAPVLEVQQVRQPSTRKSSPAPPSVPVNTVPGPSRVVDASISRRHTPPIPSAGPSRQAGSSAVPPSTPTRRGAASSARALQANRSLAGVPPASQNSELDLEAGCAGQQGTVYEALGNLREGPHHSIIAIIASPGADTKTSTGEWCRRLMLVDPSNVDPEALERGFSVNCFAKSSPVLTQCKTGDILILRGMQVVNYQSKPTGTCASYALWTWSVFVPESGKIIRAPSAPSSSQDLGQAELKYCIALGDWWRAVQKEKERVESHVIRHQIGEEDVGGSQKGRRSIVREHRLIQDATPDVHPNGYFDCTVEILHAHENNNDRVHSLYVTDYTKNEHVTPMTANWCPPTLAPYVLRLEMWGDAAALARDMQAHEFYQFDNVKIRVAPNGYWEGKFVEGRKARKLDTDELEGEPHLAALLERKKKWEDEAEEVSAHKFPHQLVAEAQLDSHFCCTVEILCMKKKGDDRTLLWVTDYTSRNDLAPIDAMADWKRGISDDRILKLALRDEQAKVAEDLQPGDIIAVRNLRLKSVSSGKPSVTGLLGGFERLIYKLNPQTTGDEGCLALLSRKKAFEKRAKDNKLQEQKPAANGKKSKKEQARREIPNIPDDAWSIKEMQDTRDPSKAAKYRVVTRVVDYYPDSIEDFVLLRCTNCEDDIPEQLKICTRCETDMSETYVHPFYKFWFDVEDTEGTRLRLAVAHPELRRRKETTQALPDFLQDYEPVDFRSEEDDTALEKLKDHLRKYLGDELVDKHSELVHTMDDAGVQPGDNPWLDLLITVTPGDKPTYLLWKCALFK